jgi:hypothetical protein
VDVLVVSSAVQEDNPEVLEAHRLRLPVVRRAEMLAELMRFRHGIAVAGTHGKTTTTSLIASILAEAGIDPTFVIGGRLNSAGANARLGGGRWLVAEADESDASFLHLQPILAVVTNVDADHLGTYEGDYRRLRQSFVQFLHNLPFYGLAVMCADDPGVREILPEIGRPVLLYGTAEEAEVRGFDYRAEGAGSRFRVALPDRAQPLEIHLNLPGRHNFLNALAAIAIARELEVPDAAGFVFTQAFQSIGLGLATAVGAAIARPARPVLALIGDGGAMMSLGELDTIAAQGLDVLVAVIMLFFLVPYIALQIIGVSSGTVVVSAGEISYWAIVAILTVYMQGHVLGTTGPGPGFAPPAAPWGSGACATCAGHSAILVRHRALRRP